jgi:4-diphosphocytidyl-2-C-methyl-D-erythritol kinase
MWQAPAKLNLGLRIVGRRPDGYHLLESLFWPITFQDELRIEPSSQSSVSCAWTEDAPFKNVSLHQDKENLVGTLLLGGFGWKPSRGFSVDIKKKIPIGSGLGGVSSNVGTLLRYLCETNEITKTQSEVLARQAGADVPFFLNPTPSSVTGIGEFRNPLSFVPGTKERLYFLLILFPFATSTPLLFKSFREKNISFSPSTPIDIERTWDFKSLCSFLEFTKNDLESLAASETPELSRALESLRLTRPLYSGLSGTGSTCFSIYPSKEKRAEAAKELQKLCRDLPCRSVLAETY